MARYQGHRSWNAWNVSLWIHNDESLYRRARALASLYGLQKAALKLASDLDGSKTPDGAPYTLTSVREALRGILD